MPLNTDDHEWLFDALAQAVDSVTAQQSSLLLAKFSMLLANQVGERALVEQALHRALAHLQSIEPNDTER
jgi:Protein of unknown function (DUF2783)